MKIFAEFHEKNLHATLLKEVFHYLKSFNVALLLKAITKQLGTI